MNKKFVVTKAIVLKTGTTVHVGTEVTVTYDTGSDPLCHVHVPGFSQPVKLKVATLYNYIKAYPKPPSNATLERYIYDSVAKTPTGAKVEPDGKAADGSVSWLRVLGLI